METANREFKRILTDGFEKEVVAFLNGVGGEIIVGADNNGNIVGVDNADGVALAISDKIKNNILPSAIGVFQIDIKIDGDKSYVVVTVAGGLEKLYYLKRYGMTPNGCFLRIGDASKSYDAKTD